MTIKTISPTTWQIPSESADRAGTVYTVVARGGDLHCNCEGFAHRNACKHVTAIRQQRTLAAQFPVLAPKAVCSPRLAEADRKHLASLITGRR